MKHFAHIERDGIKKPVKNLGWLLRNWKLVLSFEILPCDFDPMIDAVLVAHCRDGSTYRSTYASAEILRRFLDRPVFRSLPADWFIFDNGTRRSSPSREIIGR